MASERSTSPQYSKVQHTTQSSAIDDKPSPRKWLFAGNRSFIWMLLSLLSGISLSAGHHFFYARFDGQRVDDVSVSQTWIIRFGTGFAFVAKTFLVIATSIAFVQQQWFALLHYRFKVRQIDTMTGVLGNAFTFLESRIWLRFPLLTLTACIAWVLPLAAIVTPATMTVVATSSIRAIDGTPPQLHFDPARYANLQTQGVWEYQSPAPDTLGAAFGSATTKQILGIAQTESNMTYTLQFLGPALRCDYASATFVGDAYQSFVRTFSKNSGHVFRYLAWVPERNRNSSDLSALDKFNAASTLDIVSTDAAHLYIVPNITSAGPVFVGGERMSGAKEHYSIYDTLDCKLYNATYRVLFNLTFPTQLIEVQSRELLNPVYLVKEIPVGGGWAARDAQRMSYQAIMHSFGRLLVGSEYWRDGFVTTSMTSWNMMGIDWKTRNGTQQGLEQLFQNITLSMLSVPSLTMDTTMAAQNRVPVNVLNSVNVYSYSPRDLWLAYGLACGAALLSSLLGVYGIWRNGGVGYQNIFSTYIRTTRDQVLREMIDPGDRGTEPLPKQLAEASIILDT